MRNGLTLAAGMAVFGSGTPVSKLVTEAFPPLLASGARVTLAALLLLPLVLLGRGGATLRGIPRADWVRLGAIALFGMVGFSLAMLFGIAEISAALGGIVMATLPAVTAAGGVVFLRDRMDRWKALAVVLAVGGVAAANLAGAGTDGEGDVVLGIALVFGAICGEAAYSLLGKRVTADDVTPVTVAAIASAMAAVLFAGPALVQAASFDWSAPGLGDWLALGWWGAGTLALGSVLWYRGMQGVQASAASAYMGVMPVSAVVLSYVLVGSEPRWGHLVGGVAVLAGIAAVHRSDRAAAAGDEDDA